MSDVGTSLGAPSRRDRWQLVWYPFKFWRNVGYVHVTGRLAELYGQVDQRPKRRTLRAIDRAKKAGGDYLLAVPAGDWRFGAIEGWATGPDYTLRSVTARFVDHDGQDLWVVPPRQDWPAPRHRVLRPTIRTPD